MGSLFLAPVDDMPQVYSSLNFQHVVKEINKIETQICRKTDIHLVVRSDTLRLNYMNWKSSQVKATLGIFATQKKDLVEDKSSQDQHFSYLQQYQLTLNMKQVYKVYDLIKGFKQIQAQKEQRNYRQTPSSPQITQNNRNQSEISNNRCEICYDEQSDLALPCGHIFGPKCISLYIIEKEEKKCPMCRQLFLGGRYTIQKSLYRVIGDEDKCIYEGLREDLMDVLRENNNKTIRSALTVIGKQGQGKK